MRWRVVHRTLLGLTWGVAMVMLGACSRPEPGALLAQAAQAREEGRYAEATVLVKQVLERQPDNARARIDLAAILIDLGRGQAAEGELLRARGLGAPEEEVMPLLAEALLSQGAFDRVLTDIQADAGFSPMTAAQIHTARARAYLEQSRPTESLDEVRLALAAVDHDAQAFAVGVAAADARGDSALAMRYLGALKSVDRSGWVFGLVQSDHAWRQGNAREARDALAVVLGQSGGIVPPRYALPALTRAIELDLRLGDYADAATQADRLVALRPRDARGPYLQALVAYRAGDYPKALSYADQALALEPNAPDLSTLAAEIELARGNDEEAAVRARRALAVDPDHVPARRILAALQLHLRDPEGAMITLREGEVMAGDATGAALLGATAMAAGQYRAAVSYLERAIPSASDPTSLRIQLALAHLARGNTAAAEAVIDATTHGGAADWRPEALRAIAALQKGAATEARSHVESMVRASPSDVNCLRIAGGLYLRLQDRSRARDAWSRVLTLEPRDLAALSALAALDEEAGNLEAATTLYMRAHSAAPGDPGPMIALARLAGRRGQAEEMEHWLRRAAEAAPTSTVAASLLARYYLANGRLDQAEAAMAGLKEGNDALSASTQGWVHLAAGRPQQALSAFDRAQTSSPQSSAAELGYGRAQALFAVGRVEEGEAQLDAVLKVSPGYVPAAIQLAALKTKSGDQPGAWAIVSGLEGAGEQYAAWILAGDLALSEGIEDKALANYRRAWDRRPSRDLALRLYAAGRAQGIQNPWQPMEEWLRLHPADDLTRRRLAEAYLLNGAAEPAIQLYEELLQRFPEDALILNNLAWMYHERKDPRATGFAERAYKLAPDDVNVADTLGWILVQDGDAARGVPVLEHAYKVTGGALPVIGYHLATGYSRLGRGDEARSVLREVLSKDAAFPERSRAEALLRDLSGDAR